MKSPKKTVSRRKFIKKSSLLSTVPVIAAGLPTSSLANVQDTNKFLQLRWIGVGKRGTLMSLLGRRKTRRRVERGHSLIENHRSSP